MFGKSENTDKVQRFVGHWLVPRRAKYGSHYETGAHKKGKKKKTKVIGTENIFCRSECIHTT
jgi:hypothetical protein